MINKAIANLNLRDGKTSFSESQILKEVLITAQGKYQLSELQQSIKKDSQLIPTQDGKLTTFKLSRQSFKTTEPSILDLATSILNNNRELKPLKVRNDKFQIEEISDDKTRRSATIEAYLNRSNEGNKTILLTDTEQDKKAMTDEIRSRLIQDKKLTNSFGIKRLTLVNLDKEKQLDPLNYLSLIHI